LTKTRWKVRVGVEAEKDFARILKYTADTFGERQASIYKAKLTEAIAALESGPRRRWAGCVVSEPRTVAAAMSYVTTQPCVVCGRTPSEAHYIRFA
jgi:plasmid stabilization system protein ParE